jgi:hypothetical protein
VPFSWLAPWAEAPLFMPFCATLALLPTVREQGGSALSDLLYRRGLERAGGGVERLG